MYQHSPFVRSIPHPFLDPLEGNEGGPIFLQTANIFSPTKGVNRETAKNSFCSIFRCVHVEQTVRRPFDAKEAKVPAAPAGTQPNPSQAKSS
jgi:hypothetical protein